MNRSFCAFGAKKTNDGAQKFGKKATSIAKSGFRPGMSAGGERFEVAGAVDAQSQAEATTIDDATIAQVDPTATAVVL